MKSPQWSRGYPVIGVVTAVLLVANLGFVIALILFARFGGAFDSTDGEEAFFFAADVLWKLALPFMAISALVFACWTVLAILLPLARVDRCLRRDEPATLYPLLRDLSEFGGIARRLHEAFAQKASLQRELALRRELEQQLLGSEARLQELIREREAFIHDLHDGLIQNLYAWGLRLDAVQPGLPEAESALLRSMVGEVNAMLDQLRASLRGSSRSLKKIHSLGRSLASMVSRFQDKGGVEFSFQTDEAAEGLITPEQAVELHAFCAEALMNAMRHAQARTVKVRLRALPGQVELAIQDDGVGLPSTIHPGLGMESMKQRACRLGAQWTVKSVPEGGTNVSIAVPVRSAGGKWADG
jgi:signal transduction histidine kinase